MTSESSAPSLHMTIHETSTRQTHLKTLVKQWLGPKQSKRSPMQIPLISEMAKGVDETTTDKKNWQNPLAY